MINNKLLILVILGLITTACGTPSNGRTGSTGKPGTPGEVGVPGEDGTPGEEGTRGEDGATGKNGATGEAGEAGTPGEDAGLILLAEKILFPIEEFLDAEVELPEPTVVYLPKYVEVIFGNAAFHEAVLTLNEGTPEEVGCTFVGQAIYEHPLTKAQKFILPGEILKFVSCSDGEGLDFPREVSYAKLRIEDGDNTVDWISIQLILSRIPQAN